MPKYSRIARLQQALALWVWVCALAWLVWLWPHSPALAVVMFVATFFWFAGILALEFVLLWRIGRGDPTLRPTWAQGVRAWLAEMVMALRVFGWRQPFRWRAVPDRLDGPGVAGRHGVVLIHGFVCNRGFWTPWLRRLQASERAFLAVNLEPVVASIDDYVPLVQAAVERVRLATGRPPVLVCHSMGGLVARAWLRTCTDEDVCAWVVTIGSPHAGTWLARFSHLANGRQMRQDSPWMHALGKSWSAQWAPRFTCWYSNCDNIVIPPSTATLPGADNRLVLGAAHVQLAFHPQVMQATLDLLDDLRPGA